MRVGAPIVAAVLFGGIAVNAQQAPAGGSVLTTGAAPPTLSAGHPVHARRPAELERQRSSRVVAAVEAQSTVPSPERLRAAWRYARERGGRVSIAAVNSEGELRGRDQDRRYSAASLVKAMLLAAELRLLKRAGEPVDPGTDALLAAMITRSENDAADSIYARVGDSGLFEVAERAGMQRFTVAGHWGNAQITAADMARLFASLDRAFPRADRSYALGLLGSVVAEQRWGIPEAAGERWATRFKGGWLPENALVHQAAELRERDGDRELAIAILTDEQPSFEYGIETIEGVAARMLGQAP